MLLSVCSFFVQTHSSKDPAQRQLLKNIQTLCQWDPLANLRVLGTVWILSGNGGAGGCHLHILIAKAGRYYFSSSGCHFYPLNSGAPHLCSSSALLKLVVTIFIFLLETFIFSYSGRCHPHAFPLLCSTALISPSGNLLCLEPWFLRSRIKYVPDHLALQASENGIPESHETLPFEETASAGYHPCTSLYR